MDLIALPPAIHAWLVERIEAIIREPGPVVASLPAALPAGEVRNLARGGPFGWMLDARLDEIDGRVALEVLENDRMSGENHFRVWDDATVDPIQPSVQIFVVYKAGATAAERAAADEAYFANNRAAYELLRARGFLRGD